MEAFLKPRKFKVSEAFLFSAFNKNDPSGVYGVRTQAGVGIGSDAHVTKSYGETVYENAH